MAALIIKRRPGETTDQLIRRFQKRVMEEGIVEEYKEKERYKKPAERRKEQTYRLQSLFERMRDKKRK